METAVEATKHSLAFLIRQIEEYNTAHQNKKPANFNVISFGSRFESLFAKSVPCNADYAKVALAYASNLKADYGGKIFS